MLTIIKENLLKVYGYEKSLGEFIKADLTVDNPHLEQEARRLRNSLGYLGEKQRDAIIRSKVKHISPTIEDFEEKKDCLVIPRGYYEKLINALKLFGLDYKEQDNLPSFDKVDIPSKINLRDYQEPFVQKLLEAGSGIGCAPPGSGKTLSSLELMSRIGLRTLWITHTSALAKQTYNVAKEVLDIDIGMIGGGKWTEGTLTVALVQTLDRRDLSEIAKSYGTVIIDECHRAPSKTFSDTIKNFWAKHIYGLTATPYRKDQLEPLMFNSIGPINSRIEKQILVHKGQLVAAKVIRRKTSVKVPESISNFQKIMKFVNDNSKRVTLIVGDVIAEAAMGNTCVVLVDTIAYGKKIVKEIKDLGFDSEIVYNAEIKKSKGKMVRVSSMSKKEREAVIDKFKSSNLPILVATFDFLSEGFDHKPLNRLFLASPISHRNHTLIEQSCGRVERSCPGKTDALIYDYVDDGCSMLDYMATQRIAVYEDNLMELVSL